jgi:hypothetical protein
MNRKLSSPLAEISTLIRDRQSGRSGREVCLLLGAGADITSGGMTFTQFRRDFFQLVLKRPLAGSDERAVADEVDRFFSDTKREEIRARLVEATFDLNKRREPSEAYLLLALALEKVAVDLVLTTNFDVMLEAAERILGLSVLRVYAKGIALPDEADAKLREPDRVPYLKLHGCLNGRAITHITDEELDRGSYAAPFRTFLKHRLESADMIITGYSGSDPNLARLIASCLSDHRASVYWCDPQPPRGNSPLARAVGRRRIVHVSASFRDTIEAISRPILESPSYTSAKPVFISCLLDWRVGRARQEFLNAHAYREHRDIRRLLVRRRTVESQIDRFLESDKPMTIVVGPSGTGKSALGVRLSERYGTDPSYAFLPISANQIAIGRDFADQIAAQLGGLGSRIPFNFGEFERWLRTSRRKLIVYLDALNEHAVALDHVASLFRDVVRFSYFLPSSPPVRVIATIRQETWNRLCAREDRGRIAEVCWNPTGAPGTVGAIQLQNLSTEELTEALELLCYDLEEKSIVPDLPPQVIERLKDPYLLATVSDEVLHSGRLDVISWIHGPALALYERILRAKLARSDSDRDARSLEIILARAALLTLQRDEDFIREIDVRKLAASSMTFDAVRVFTDLGILAATDDGRLRFTHERTQEYFLARALGMPDCPFTLTTPDALNRVLEDLDSRHVAIAAVRTFFLLDPSRRIPLVVGAVSRPGALSDANGAARLLSFAKELMVDLACDNPEEFGSWFTQTMREVASTEEPIVSGPQGEAVERHWRAMIQAAVHLPDHQALQLLTRGAKVGAGLAKTDAEIYATDKVVRLTLRSGAVEDLLDDLRFHGHYTDPEVPRLRRIGRILGLMSQIGPDNSHPREYDAIRRAAWAACKTTLESKPVSAAEVKWLTDFIFRERDRYLFNGNLQGMKRFFRNPNRESFLRILDRIAEGDVLRHSDIETLDPYISEMYQDLEFQLGNFLFIFSARNDLARTRTLWIECFDTFDNSTPPEKVDFFQATAVYMYVVNGYPYDDLLTPHIDRILRECPRVIEYEPGQERGYSRGFTDEFDMVFEDGFNPIASYATLLPSGVRQDLTWHEYSSRDNHKIALPIFSRHLTDALGRGEMRKALKILHALGQFIILWPQEGLWTMSAPLQHDHPVVRRAAIRVLAEAYNRHPVETLRFLAGSGLVLSPGDMRDIRARVDPRAGRRQFEGLQWARVLHFLLSLPEGPSRVLEALRITYTASSVRNTLQRVAGAFSWM